MAEFQSRIDYTDISEVHVLYGTIEHDKQEDVLRSANNAMTDFINSGSRRISPINLKKAFKNAFAVYTSDSGKPGDYKCVSEIKRFFCLAVCSGTKTADDLANKIGGNATAQIMIDMAHFAKAQHYNNMKCRKQGRARRSLSKG